MNLECIPRPTSLQEYKEGILSALPNKGEPAEVTKILAEKLKCWTPNELYPEPTESLEKWLTPRDQEKIKLMLVLGESRGDFRRMRAERFHGDHMMTIAGTCDGVGGARAIVGLLQQSGLQLEQLDFEAQLDEWPTVAQQADRRHLVIVGTGEVNIFATFLHLLVQEFFCGDCEWPPNSPSLGDKFKVIDKFYTRNPYGSKINHYGAVLLLKNPWNPDFRLLWIAGLTGLASSAGCSQVASNWEQYRTQAKKAIGVVFERKGDQITPDQWLEWEATKPTWKPHRLPPPPQKKGITWLHLSDWHQQGKEFDRKVVRDELVKDIRNRKKISQDLAQIDFIVFSGDVAFSGKEEEYKTAIKQFFEPVLEATGLTKEYLFIVPGNHDLDRTKFKLLPQALTKPFASQQQVQEWLTDQEMRNHLLEPFKDYKQFATNYAEQNQPDYANIRQWEINGKRVALLGINSALMAGRNSNLQGEVDDYGKLVVGEPQIYDPLRQLENYDLRIAVLHHPFEWLAQFDNKIEPRLRQNFQFILCGHQHRSEVCLAGGTRGGDCVIIPAGASYDNRDVPNGYNFVHLDFEPCKGTVYLRRWDNYRAEWIKDESAHPNGQFDLGHHWQP